MSSPTHPHSPYIDPTVAATYARIAHPRQFAQPAKYLVEVAGVRPGDAVLDVGTGTGAVGYSAVNAVGHQGMVVGIDASITMLRTPNQLAYPVAVAVVPALPFRDGTFDAVLAGFVVSHFSDVGAALAELRRVCRPGGRFAATGWGALPNAAAQLWSSIAGRFASADVLDREFRRLIPGEALFSDPQMFRQIVEAAGFANVRMETREYEIDMPTADFLQSREAGVQGTILRRLVSESDWDRFRVQITDEFQSAFGDHVRFVRDVHFIVGWILDGREY